MRNVPKVAHFYWGAEILPWLRFMTIYSFRKFHPSWKIILWVPEKANKNYNWKGPENKNDLTGKDYMPLAHKLVNEVNIVDMKVFELSNDLPEVTKSDYLRLHLLANVPGAWFDMDILFFRPLEDAFLQTDHKAYICYQKDKPDGNSYHSIGLLMSAPNNHVWADLLFFAKKHIDTYDYQAIGSPFYEQYIDENDPEICNFSISIIYPSRWPDRIWKCPAQEILAEFKPETVGLHWYNGWPFAAQQVALLTEENYQQYDNVVCHLLNQILSR